MIQRIQSLYWLFAAALLVTFYFSDFAFVKSAVVSLTLSAFYGIECTPAGVYETSITTWPLHVLVVLATLLTFITIFLFKRRALQIRLSAVSIVLDLGLMGMAYLLPSGCQWYCRRTRIAFHAIPLAFHCRYPHVLRHFRGEKRYRHPTQPLAPLAGFVITSCSSQIA